MIEIKEDTNVEMEETVNHPSHYCKSEDRPDAIECFEEFEMIYGTKAAMWACLFNLHKYRYRSAGKNGLNDLKKSDWYSNKFKELKKKVKMKEETSLTITPQNMQYVNGIDVIPCSREE